MLFRSANPSATAPLTPHRRRLRPSPANRLDQKCHLAPIVLLTEACFPGSLPSPGIREIPRRRRRASSPIAAASDLLRPRRILCRVRGEPVPLFDPSSLFPVACIVVLVLVGLSPSAVAIVVATVLVRSLRGRFMVAAVFRVQHRVSSPR